MQRRQPCAVRSSFGVQAIKLLLDAPQFLVAVDNKVQCGSVGVVKFLSKLGNPPPLGVLQVAHVRIQPKPEKPE